MSSGLSARGHGPAAPRILLVDDDRDLLVPLAEQLRLDGFDVTTARDGEEALRRLDSEERSYPSLNPTAHLSLAAQHARLQMAM